MARPREEIRSRAADEVRFREMNNPPIQPSVIRRAEKGDTPEIARLLPALEHSTSAEAFEARWDDWSTAGNFALIATQRNGTLAGLATLGRMVVLHRPKSVGRAPVSAAEEALAQAS